MAWQQWRVLLAGEVQSSDDATKILKLPLSNVLHTLWLKTEITNGSTSAQDLDITDVIDKVEVIANGSEVIVSLNATDLELLGLLALGHWVPEIANEAGGATQMAMYPILFGRDIFDPNYWLPCSKFADLELKIQYSPSISATAFATGTTTFTVVGLMTMGGDPGAYKGTLKTSTVYSFTTAASGDEVIDLPKRNLYRRILVSCYEAGVADGTDITHVKLDVNNGERVYIDMDWDDLKELNHALFPLFPERNIHLFRSDTDTVDTRIAPIQTALLTVYEDVDITNDTFILDRIDTVAGDRVTINSSQADITSGSEDLTAYTTDHDMFLRVVGRGLPNAVVIPFDVVSPEGWFDSSAWDQVQLTLTQGGAGGAARVILQEVLQIR